MSEAPGELTITWDRVVPVPSDYRVVWAREGEDFRTWTDLSWNAFPTGERLHLSGLDEGVTYKVSLRARFNREPRAGKKRWSGPWSETYTATVQTSPPTQQQNQDDENPPPTQQQTEDVITGVSLVSEAPGASGHHRRLPSHATSATTLNGIPSSGLVTFETWGLSPSIQTSPVRGSASL